MAIEEIIGVQAGGAVDGINAVADAFERLAAKAAESVGKINASLDSIGGGGGAAAGADKLAASMEAAAAKIAEAADKAGASLGKIGDAADSAAGGVERLDQAAAAAEGSLSDAAAGADEAAAASSRLADSADAAGAALDKQAIAGERAGKSSAEGAAAGGSFWGGLKTVMLGTAVAAGYGIDKAMKYQSQMLLLHTQAGVSVKDTQAMSQGVLQISSQTGQSLSGLSESAYHVASNMASMGATVPQMLGAVKIAAEGAAVGHSNLVDTTNAMTAAIASGIPGVSNYSQAMGVLNATVGSGDMSMQDLAEAFGGGMVATVKGYGLTLRDVGAATAVFGDNNIRGARAGTDLRMAVQALAVPMKTAPLEKFGLQYDTLAKDMQKGGLTKALDDLTGRFKTAGLTSKTEGEWITALFGKKAGSGIAVLLEQMDRYHSKLPLLTKDANSFNAAWEATQATPAQKWKELTAGLQAGAVGFGTALLPAFTTAAGFADRLLTDINGSKTGAAALALSFGGLAALFTAKKLTSGIESAFKTGETVLSGVGKVAQTLNIPGLSKLAGIGSSGAAGMQKAGDTVAEGAGAMQRAADTMAEAAGAMQRAADTMAEAAGAADLGKGGSGLPGAAGRGKSAAEEEQAARDAEQAARDAEKAAPKAEGLLPKLLGGVKSLGEIATGPVGWGIGITDMLVKPALQSMSSGPGGKNWWENPFGESRKTGWLASFAPWENAARQMDPITSWSGLGHDISTGFGLLGSGGSNSTAASSPSVMPATGSYLRVAGGVPATSYQAARPLPPAPPPPAPTTLPGYRTAAGLRGTETAGPDIKAKLSIDTTSLNEAKTKAENALQGISSAKVQPVKVPAPDLSAVTSAKTKAMNALQQISDSKAPPIKIPEPDTSGVTTAKTKVISTLNSMVGPATAAGAGAGAGLAAGILSEQGAVEAAAQTLASDAAAALQTALQVHSPSRVTWPTGEEFTAGFAGGIHSAKSKAKAKAATMSIAASTVTSLTQGLQGGRTAIDAALTALTGSAGRPQDVQQIDSTVSTLIGDLSTAKGKKIIGAGEDSSLVRWLKTDQGKLDALAAKRAVLITEITTAQQTAQSVISGASIMNAANAQPASATPAQSSFSLVQGMQYQAQQAKQFAGDLARLKKAGVNATTLDQISQAGADQGDSVAQGILSGGKGTVKQLNQLQQQITASAGQIGDVAGPAAYQSGQDISGQTAKGLKSQLSAVDSQMKQIAQSMVNAVTTAVKGGNLDAAMKAAGSSAGQSFAGGILGQIPSAQSAAAQLAQAAAQAAASAAQGHSAGNRPSHPHPAHPDMLGGPVERAPYRPPPIAGGGHGGGSETINVTVHVTVSPQDFEATVQTVSLEHGNRNWQPSIAARPGG